MGAVYSSGAVASFNHHDRKNVDEERSPPYDDRLLAGRLWLPLVEEVRADKMAMALMSHGISVSTAEPFATSAQVPHAMRLALGSVELDTLRDALEKVKRVINDPSY